MSERKMKVGIVGAGRIAQTYAQVFAASDIAKVVGVADARRDAARAMAETLNCESFESHEAMAAAVQPEATVICTPPVTHPELCLFFLERGVHVLCEKPLAIDSASAREMLAAADRNGVKLTMASKFRYVDDVIRARSILLSGILGDLVLYESSFTAHVDMSGRWNSDPAVSGGGVLIDNGTHSLDMFRYLVGPLTEIQVIEGKRSQGLAVEETVHIFVRSTQGVMGSIDLSWTIQKDLDNYINIYGSHGTVSVGWKQSKYRQAGSRDWVVFGQGYNKLEAFQSQVNNFLRGIRGEEPLLIDSEDVLASVEAMEAGYRALQQSQWTRLGSLNVNAPAKDLTAVLA
ncbi:MAG: Gfo/Idh/MocA family oxidoreductase [Acidobacteriia bacterium]|nr:Gfo/Idh/MocA family oxidoreductase [Terriglobia bacterium]